MKMKMIYPDRSQGLTSTFFLCQLSFPVYLMADMCSRTLLLYVLLIFVGFYLCSVSSTGIARRVEIPFTYFFGSSPRNITNDY